ncbi:aldolase [Aureococcus anophagefferens]|nr:aldolase [Aureococcus anophagefferens]
MAFVHGSKVARAASRVASRSIYTKTVDNYESVLDRFARDRLTAVLRTPTAEAAPKAMAAAIDGGFKIAEFTLTTPGCLDAVADFRGKYDGDVMRNIVCVPGCQTPTELYTAYTLGAPLQKVFPGVAGAVTWVKAVSAALPMLRLNPTSGVDLDNAGEYLSNGAASVGLVVGNAAKAGPFVRKPTGFQLAKLWRPSPPRREQSRPSPPTMP